VSGAILFSAFSVLAKRLALGYRYLPGDRRRGPGQSSCRLRCRRRDLQPDWPALEGPCLGLRPGWPIWLSCQPSLGQLARSGLTWEFGGVWGSDSLSFWSLSDMVMVYV
jgi:hypothetical protein